VAELTALRTYNAKTHEAAGGFTLEAHAGHIHYKDGAGDYQEVDLTFEDMGTYWRVTKASYRLYVAKDFGASDLIRFDNRYEGANHSIYYEPHSLWWIDADDTSQRTLLASAASVMGVASGTTITYTDAFGSGVDFVVTLQRSGFRKEVVFDAQPAGSPYANYHIGFVCRWQATGLTLKADGGQDWDGSTWYETQERLTAREAGGARSYIQRAHAVDADDRRRRLKVFWELRGGSLWQGKLLTKLILENATYPLRADITTSYYVGVGDGHVKEENNNTTWDAVHDTDPGDGADYTSQSCKAQCESVTASPDYFGIVRAFFPVDTSAVPDPATITAATLYVWLLGKTNGDNDGDDWLTVVQTNQANTAELVVEDFDQCGDAVDNPTEGIDVGARIDLTGAGTGAYLSWALNATGLGWIDKTGVTKLGIREGHDVIDSAIANDTNNVAAFRTSEQTGTNEDPYLSVTYTVPVPPKMYHYMHH
jgi:hypothetical protein